MSQQYHVSAHVNVKRAVLAWSVAMIRNIKDMYYLFIFSSCKSSSLKDKHRTTSLLNNHIFFKTYKLCDTRAVSRYGGSTVYNKQQWFSAPELVSL